MRSRPVLAAGLAGALLFGSAGLAGATADARSNRLFGPDRYVTARAIATATFTESTVAILAGGESPADALAAAYLSGAQRAPLLLTQPNVLSPGIVNTLTSMNVQGVQVIGGTSAVSEVVVDQLEAEGFEVVRLDGVDRYDTARKAAELLPREAIGEFEAGKAAIVVTGESYADALAAGPISAGQGLPILLTNSAGLHHQARAALTSLDIKQVLIVGGFDAVSAASQAQIEAMGIPVRRVAGTSRHSTAVQVAEVAQGELGFAMTSIELARGDSYADALAGAIRGGQIFAPILLTEGNSLGPDARNFIRKFSARIATIDVLGGIEVIPEAVAADAVTAAKNL